MNAIWEHALDTAALLTAVDGNKQTVLHICVQANRPMRVMLRLIQLGWSCDATDLDGHTPANLARAAGRDLEARLIERAAIDQQRKQQQQQQQVVPPAVD